MQIINGNIEDYLEVIESKVVCYFGAGKTLKKFFERYNCTISLDYMSNLDIEEGINTTVCMDGRYIIPKKVKELLPDIVISFGGQIFSSIKEELQLFEGKFEHWLIQEDGRVIDAYKSLTDIFECKPEYFFDKCNEMTEGMVNDRIYFSEFKEYADNIKIPEFPWSHVYAIKEVVEKIPSNSVLHLSINDSIRITNFFKLNSGIKVYANIGTHGIDGCLSSFLGQAAATDRPSYLVIGDLAFFYDMNALGIRHIKKNVRIILINNGGGAEFKIMTDAWKEDVHVADFISANGHNGSAKGWAENCGFIYFSATDESSFEKCKVNLISRSDKPIILEVFTYVDNEKKANDLILASNRISSKTDNIKALIKNVLGEKGTDVLKKIIIT